MKIIIIRHGDPDNPHNCLTPQGYKEVELLGEFLKDFHYDKAFTSPLARALITSEEVLKHHNDHAEILPWLQEFLHLVNLPYEQEKHLTWDLMPSYYLKEKDLFDNDKYLDHPMMVSGDIKSKYEEVVNSFDEILKEYGYERQNNYYKVNSSNRKTLVFFCHFGMMTVLMSHLMNIPYVILDNTMICSPSGITTFVTEEREKGTAIFRCMQFGDISHLNIGKEKPSFHGRFCEIYDCDERH